MGLRHLFKKEEDIAAEYINHQLDAKLYLMRRIEKLAYKVFRGYAIECYLQGSKTWLEISKGNSSHRFVIPDTWLFRNDFFLIAKLIEARSYSPI